MPRPAVYLHVEGFESYGRLDFDKKEIRKAMRQAGRVVQAEGRRLVSKGGPSRRGEYPARRTGRLRRSITYRVSRPGFLVKIEPKKTAAMGDDFYPAYLFYGVRRGAKRGKSHAKRASTGGWRIAPRRNFMEDALDNRAGRVRALLSRAFSQALK